MSAKLLFVCGDQSGAGKTTVCLAIIGFLLKNGYETNDIAYIKPCTQCEDVQLVSKYCEKIGVAHQGIGPVRFYPGFTQEVIDGKDEGVSARHEKIKKAVSAIAQGKKLVIVDGVGYPAVGSVAGVSNADIAALLGAPVLLVGRPGLGNAIDAANFILTYFQSFGVRVLGGVWNKIPAMSTYHPFEQCKTYVTRYFQKFRPGFSVYGHVPLKEEQKKLDELQQQQEDKPVACYLRQPKKELVMTQQESDYADEIIEWINKNVQFDQLLKDLDQYYSTKISSFPASSSSSSSSSSSPSSDSNAHCKSSDEQATATIAPVAEFF